MKIAKKIVGLKPLMHYCINTYTVVEKKLEYKGRSIMYAL